MYRYGTKRWTRLLLVLAGVVVGTALVAVVVWAVVMRPPADSAVAAEVRRNAHQLARMERNLALVAESLDEIRLRFGLDTTEIEAFEDPGDAQAESPEASIPSGVEQAVQLLSRLQDNRAREALLQELVESRPFLNLLDELDLDLTWNRSDEVVVRDRWSALVTLTAVAGDRIRITRFGRDQREVVDPPGLPSELLRDLVGESIGEREAHETMVRGITEAVESRRDLGLRVEERHRSPIETSLVVRDGFGREQLVLEVDTTAMLHAASRFDGNAAMAQLDRLLSGLVIRNPREEAQDRARDALTLLMTNSDLARLLDAEGLRAAPPIREEEEYFHLDIVDTEGRPVGSMSYQLEHEKLWVFDAEGVPVSSLDALGSRRDPPRLPSADGEEADVVAILGTHERLADTIVLVAGDRRRRSISLMSIPRDLFYQGRKINTVYRSYGPRQLLSDLSTMTGLEINRYVAIDMYAFIDAVDILGGITLELEEDLVDPSYRTKDDGLWGTLAYAAGTHHLSGREALRIARSRYVSSDFGRASRQQDLLEALLAQLGRAGIAEAAALLGTLSGFIETNISLPDLIELAVAYRDAHIASRSVMSSYNVLYATYTNLYYSNRTLDEVEPDFYVGSWILVPRDERWDEVRRYVHEAFFGGEL